MQAHTATILFSELYFFFQKQDVFDFVCFHLKWTEGGRARTGGPFRKIKSVSQVSPSQIAQFWNSGQSRPTGEGRGTQKLIFWGEQRNLKQLFWVISSFFKSWQRVASPVWQSPLNWPGIMSICTQPTVSQLTEIESTCQVIPDPKPIWAFKLPKLFKVSNINERNMNQNKNEVGVDTRRVSQPEQWRPSSIYKHCFAFSVC